jgi:hypothetical protein
LTIFTLSRRTSGAIGDITELSSTILRRLTDVLLPLAVLAAAVVIVPRVNLLPPSLAGLRGWGPTLLIITAGSLALAFNRGRVLFAVAALAAGFAGYKLLGMPQWAGFPARTVFAAICIFVRSI